MQENQSKFIVISKDERNDKALIFTPGFHEIFVPKIMNFLKETKEDPRFRDWNIYLFPYRSSLLGPAAPITSIASSLQSEACDLSEHQLALVGYSMGGLITKKALLSFDKQNVERVKYYGTIGTPHLGAPIAALQSEIPTLLQFLVKKQVQVQDLAPGSGFLTELDNASYDKFSNPSFSMRIIGAKDDAIVPLKSALYSSQHAHKIIVPGGHLDLIGSKREAILNILGDDLKAISRINTYERLLPSLLKYYGYKGNKAMIQRLNNIESSVSRGR